MFSYPGHPGPAPLPAGRMTMAKGRIAIPEPMQVEHAELHEALADATASAGPVGEAARDVARLLRPHFVREEQIALPPLGLLPDLAQGAVTPEMAQVLPLTDALEAALPGMLREHDAIGAAAAALRNVARAARRPDVERLAEKILLHARAEELVTYPAALLVGRSVRAALGR